MIFSGSQSANAMAGGEPAAPAQAIASASGNTSVSVNVPDFIILHYVPNLTLNLAAASQGQEEGDRSWKVNWDGTASGGNELDAGELETVADNYITTTLPNMWAVRGFSNDGTAEVKITVPETGKSISRSNNGIDSNITITSAAVDDGSKNGDKITTALKGITKSNATFGNVILKLNLTNTKLSGLHTGGEYQITASTY